MGVAYAYTKAYAYNVAYAYTTTCYIIYKGVDIWHQ